MKSIVVFCGSSYGYNETYADVAYQLGAVLAEKNIEVIYGGSKLGLMGAVAEGCLQHNGKITGIIPSFLRTKEIAHDNLTELITVETMHERKLKMHEKSEGIIALPGGWGTMEELFEMMTWSQLGLHQKPIGILNINGFYEAFMVMLNNMVLEGFLKEDFMKSIIVSSDIFELLSAMWSYQPITEIPKWISEQKT
jgi:uncharacterized protein (TIGR00730 family)